MAPKLTLAMICKDEESNLAQCLDSVRAHVDEIVVVDTGSTDGTRAVATRYGASVFPFTPESHPASFYRDDEATCQIFGAPGPYSGEMTLADFGAARNESFRHASGDYILWLDADDVLEGAEHLRTVVTDIANRGLVFGFLAYNYASDHLGRVYYRQWRERIVKRGNAQWLNPVHEVLLPTVPAVGSARYEMPVVNHRRRADRKSTPHRNLKILLRQLHQVRNTPGAQVDPRTLFYLGNEARFVDPKRAAGFYEEYLGKSGWPEERAAAHVALGQMMEFGALGQPVDAGYSTADREYAAAAIEMPDNPDGLFGLARIAYLRGRWADCCSYTERAFKIGNTDSLLGANPMDRLYRPHVFYNHALYHLGRIEEAAASCRAGLQVCPDDPGVPGGAQGMLSLNLRVYEEELERRRQAAQPKPADPNKGALIEWDKNEDVDAPPVINIPRDCQLIWAMQLWKQVVHSRDGKAARMFLDSLPLALREDPVFQRMVDSTERRFGGVDGKVPLLAVNQAPSMGQLGSSPSASTMNIVMWIGPAIEAWDPLSPNTKGVGGSETACIEVCKNLAHMGHKVTVYGCCPDSEGIYDGVVYKHFERLRDEAINCDVFISSRAPSIMAANKVRAKLSLLWVHDIHVGPPSPDLDRWLLKFDRILCLSQWHKQFFLSVYPGLHPDRVVVTRNGIDPKRFAQALPKTNRAIFSSSPNRGLDTLLVNWPFVRQKVPDAELHVYYGFDVWEAFARGRNDPAELADIQRYKTALENAVRGGGVFWHGRVDQRTLAEAFLRSKVWAYPTNFSETSCISAMEAQAAGAVPVCTKLAALPETVQHGILIEPGPNYGNYWVEYVARLLSDENYRLGYANEGRQWALSNLSWSGLASDWVHMFNDLIQAVADNPVPIWRSA